MMAEQPANSDVAAGLVRELERSAELIDAGTFTLDFAAAREKLAEYRLADPQAYVLLLVEAAHLLRGCSQIAFEITADETRVRLTGARLDAHELRSLFDAVFVDLTTLDRDAKRAALGRQRLALAIDAALGQPGARVELRATSIDQQGLVLRFSAEGQSIDETTRDHSVGLSLVFERPSGGSDDITGQQRGLLERRARYAKLLVLVDGERVDVSTPLADVAKPVDVHADGELVGRAGWSAARAEATIVLVAHGVILEELHQSDWQPGFIALLDVGDLRRDLSLTKLVRDDAFAARIEAVRVVHDAPRSHSAEASYAFAKEDPNFLRRFLMVVVALFPAAGIFALMEFRDLALACGSMGIVLSVVLVGTWVGANAQRRAQPAIGVIEAVQSKRDHRKNDALILTITLRIAIPDRKAPVVAEVTHGIKQSEAMALASGPRWCAARHSIAAAIGTPSPFRTASVQ